MTEMTEDYDADDDFWNCLYSFDKSCSELGEKSEIYSLLSSIIVLMYFRDCNKYCNRKMLGRSVDKELSAIRKYILEE